MVETEERRSLPGKRSPNIPECELLGRLKGQGFIGALMAEGENSPVITLGHPSEVEP